MMVNASVARPTTDTQDSRRWLILAVVGLSLDTLQVGSCHRL